MLIVVAAVERYLKPIITEPSGQTLEEIKRTSSICRGIGLLLSHVAHVVVVADTHIGSHIPMSCRVKSGIKVKTTVGVPITIDVLRTRLTAASRGIVNHKVRDCVTDVAVVGVKNNGALVLLDVIIVIDIQRVGELWFQSWVTRCDVKRVRVIPDGKQLGDFRLARIAPIVEPKVLLVGEFVVEVNGGRDVDHGTHRINVDASVVLNEVGMLRLNKDTHVVVVFLLPVTQRQTDVVGIVLVFGVAAEILVEIRRQGIRSTRRTDGVEPRSPLTVIGYHTSKWIHRQMREVVSQTVALVLIIAQLVAGLQMGTLPERFAVEGREHITLIVRRCCIVA